MKNFWKIIVLLLAAIVGGLIIDMSSRPSTVAATTIQATPSATHSVSITATPLATVQVAGNWLTPVPTVAMPTPLLAPAQVIIGDRGEGYALIKQAVAMEPGCKLEFIYPTWITETGQPDCSAYENVPAGPNNPCKSKANALGSMQFLYGTFRRYADYQYQAGAWIRIPGSGADLNLWRGLDPYRVACRMFSALKLFDQPTREAFIARFTGSDGGPCWNANPDQAATIWDFAHSPVYP